MKKVIGIVLALLVLSGLAGCSFATEKVMIGGSSSVVERVPDAASPAPEPESRPQNSDTPPAGGTEPEESTDPFVIAFSPDEAFCERAVKQLDNLFDECNYNPFFYQLGLHDLNQDGVPELVVNTLGLFDGTCSFFDIAQEKTSLLAEIPWSFDAPKYFVQRFSETVTLCMFEGEHPHGRERPTVNTIVYPSDEGLHAISCWRTILLDGPDYEPYAVSFYVRHKLMKDSEILLDESEEKASFLLEEYSMEEIEQEMSGSVYQSYVEGNWIETSPPWVLEEELCDYTEYWGKTDPDTSRERIEALYAAWQAKQAL